MEKVLIFFLLFIYTLGQIPLSLRVPLKYHNISPSNASRKYEKECIKQTGVDIMFYEQVKSDNWESEFDGIMAWALCYLVKFGLMTKQGVFKLDAALSRFKYNGKDWHFTEKTMHDCIVMRKLPAPQAAWQFFKCYHQYGYHDVLYKIFE